MLPPPPPPSPTPRSTRDPRREEHGSKRASRLSASGRKRTAMRCGELCLYRRGQARARIAQTDRPALILVKRPPLHRQDQEGGSFPSAGCRFAVQGSSQLRYTGSRGGSIDRSDPSAPARGASATVPRGRASSGDRESRAGRMASACYRNHERCTFSCSSFRAPISCEFSFFLGVSALLSAAALPFPLADAARPETLPSVCVCAFCGKWRGGKALWKMWQQGSHHNRKNTPCHATQINPFLLASGFPFECGASFVGNHGLLEYVLYK